MGKNELIQLFGEKKVRTSWDPEQEKWYFSIVDVCGVLTDSKDYLTALYYVQQKGKLRTIVWRMIQGRRGLTDYESCQSSYCMLFCYSPVFIPYFV